MSHGLQLPTVVTMVEKPQWPVNVEVEMRFYGHGTWPCDLGTNPWAPPGPPLHCLTVLLVLSLPHTGILTAPFILAHLHPGILALSHVRAGKGKGRGQMTESPTCRSGILAHLFVNCHPVVGKPFLLVLASLADH
jgi:hypothetical protein